MKKILLFLATLFIIISWISNVYSGWDIWAPTSPVIDIPTENNNIQSNNSVWEKTDNSNKSSWIKVYISIDFSPVISVCSKDDDWYYCIVPKWVNWFNIIMSWLIKYITFIASLAWVLFIVVNWIMYSMWWADDSLKIESKKRIVQTLIWLIILLMSWVILRIVAPWVYL